MLSPLQAGGAVRRGGVRGARMARGVRAAPRVVRARDFASWLPPLDEATAQQKERDQQILLQKMGRSKWSEAVRAGREKLYLATEAQLEDATQVAGGAGGEREGAWSGGGLLRVPFRPPAAMRVEGLYARESEVDGGGVEWGQLVRRGPAVVTVSFQALGHGQLADVHAAILDAHAAGRVRLVPPGRRARASDEVALLDVGVVDSFAMTLLRWALIGGMRRAVPPQLRPYALASFQRLPHNVENLCFDLRIHNRVMQHTFVVDRAGLVRWRMHAEPAPAELDALIVAIQHVARA
jgi:hypothetical protein